MKPVWSGCLNSYIDLEWTTGSMHPKKQALDVFNMSRTVLRLSPIAQANSSIALVYMGAPEIIVNTVYRYCSAEMTFNMAKRAVYDPDMWE